MANETDLLTGSIDDYLLGIADGLQKAQRQLTQMGLSVQPGELGVTYQIPRLDFELKMSFEMQVDERGVSQLRFRPSSGKQRSASTTTEASSVIKGSFVSVPTHGGKPLPVLETELRRIDPRKLEVKVRMRSSAGERLPGVDVQFNVDRERSSELTPVVEGDFETGVYDTARADYASFFVERRDLSLLTTFWDGLVQTDSDGVAVGVLSVDPSEPPGACVAAVVDALGQTQTILFWVEP